MKPETDLGQLAALISIKSATAFVRESNRIEGIHREPTNEEVSEHMRFVALKRVNVAALQRFVSAYQPGAELRCRPGMDVRVGPHLPPLGGPAIKLELEAILMDAEKTEQSAFRIHQRYETLHPFIDGNGRSGRVLWAWQMQEYPIGFLHHWYYQSLQYSGARQKRKFKQRLEN